MTGNIFDVYILIYVMFKSFEYNNNYIYYKLNKIDYKNKIYYVKLLN